MGKTEMLYYTRYIIHLNIVRQLSLIPKKSRGSIQIKGWVSFLFLWFLVKLYYWYFRFTCKETLYVHYLMSYYIILILQMRKLKCKECQLAPNDITSKCWSSALMRLTFAVFMDEKMSIHNKILYSRIITHTVIYNVHWKPKDELI